jgi:hypothetical protein
VEASVTTPDTADIVIGSDPATGFVYVGQDRLTLREARELVADLLWHMERAARGEEPSDGWPEERDHA